MADVRPLRPDRTPPPGNLRGRRIRAWILLGLIPAILIILSLLRLWVDFLWFEELDHREVIVTRLQWSALMGLVAGLLAFALVYLNLRIALHNAKNDLYVP